jgi:hypothetical protein
MRHFPLVAATLAIALTGAGGSSIFCQSAAAQNTVSANSDLVKIVATAEIDKFDAKKKSFEIKLTFDSGPANAPVNRQQSQSTMPPMGRRGGMGGMGGGRRNAPTSNQNRPQTTTLTVTVFGSDNTLLKDGDAIIKFTSLKNGERVTITGIHRESGINDIEALEISRTTSGGY